MLLSCPLCEYTSGQEPRFYDHLRSIHNEDPLQLYVRIFCDGKNPRCQCSDACEENIKWRGWKLGFTSKFCRGHNARVMTVFSDPELQTRCAEKRIGTSSWNAGLTTETDSRIASKKISDTLRSKYASGYVNWTYLDPERSKIVAAQISKTKKEKFANGELHSWNEGLTKETNASIERTSEKLKERAKNRNFGKRLSNDTVLSRIQKFSDTFELMSDVNDYRTRHDVISLKCKSCGTIQEKTLTKLQNCPICFTCHPKESRE